MKDGEGEYSSLSSETLRLGAAEKEKKKTLLSSCICSQQQCCFWKHNVPWSPHPVGLGAKGRL